MSYTRPRGVLETAIWQFRKEAEHPNEDEGIDRYVTVDAISRFVYKMIIAKYDAHVLFVGNNGSGKSMAMLVQMRSLAKVMGLSLSFKENETNSKMKFVYAFHTREMFMRWIQENSKCIFGLDEIKTLFDYKRHQSKKQIDLYNTIEIARSHLNAYVGCTRDIDKVDNNYRNAKVQILIRIWDKVMDEQDPSKMLYAYGSVFVGNPAVEVEDKFMQWPLKSANSIPMAMKIAENLPTFVGMIVIKDVHEYGLTDEDIQVYEAQKEMGIAHNANQRTGNVGRPRTKPLPDPSIPKRKPGRPRKVAV